MAIDWATSAQNGMTAGIDLHLELDPTAGRRAALERALRTAIRDRQLPAGTRLPSTRALAAELDLARGTVSAAYDQLVAEGYLSARVGSGTVVADVVEPRPATDAGPPTRATIAPRHDLRPGTPDVSMFPTAVWLRAARRALSRAPVQAFDYADPRGRIELRTALAEYLARARGVLASPDRIVVTSGYGQALALLAGVVRAPIAMEDPGLRRHRDVVRHAGSAVVALPVDDRGARTDLLGRAEAVRAAVVTPAHQYPTGATLHPDRRRALTEWARARDGLVIEDDYDGEFRYDRQPVGAVQGTAPDHVAYVGTASKTLGPGLRLAWMVLPEPLLEPVLYARLHTDLHTETPGQLTLAEMITSHAYDRHIRAGRLRYRRRRDLLVERLRRRPVRHFTVEGIAAGLHVMLGVPDGGPTEPELLAHAAAHGLALGGLAGEWHDPTDRPQGLIVGYATPSESSYPAALDALVRVLRTAR
jgi:GntR family transcriptional regulator/MocR family aminotransferase